MGAPNLPPTQTPTNLLDFVSPTQFVDLPSKGKIYTEGHPLYNKDSVEIRFMTAKDEDILSSESLLKKGIAIDRFVQNVLIDKQISVDSLLIGDKNAILVASRISGYGNLYETELICPVCNAKNQLSFDLNTVNTYYGCVDDEQAENGKYTLALPISKVNLEIRLLTSKDEKTMIKKIRAAQKKKDQSTTITDQYKMMIISAQGITDQSQIAQFIDLMPVQDSKALREHYKQICPNIEMKEEFECTSCAHEQELEVPFGADFFWPKS